jgi:osmotically-inducible protein OsmY
MNDIISLDSQARAAVISGLAQERLRQSPYYYLKRLGCRFESGVLTLCGCVPYGQLRHLAEAIVSRVEGVQQVDNRVEVINPAGSPSGAPRARSAG